MKSPICSIVIPVYNEEEIIATTHARVKAVMAGLSEDYEIVYVNDGSSDGTLPVLKGLCETDPAMRIIDFSRNFGHQIAISAGMDNAEGEAVVVMDADLQDPPEIIPQMIEKWKEGYEVVYGRRTKREGESMFKKLTASLFYRILKGSTSVDIPLDTGDFRLMDRRVIDTMRSIREKNRFVRGLVSWVGFRQTSVGFSRDRRMAGKTKYPLSKMVKFALDGIISFSTAPLKLASWLGFLISGASFIYILVIAYEKLFTTRTVAGWASLASINLFFNGIILIILGIIGEYIGRIYDETKNRPLYIIREKIGYGRDAEK